MIELDRSSEIMSELGLLTRNGNEIDITRSRRIDGQILFCYSSIYRITRFAILVYSNTYVISISNIIFLLAIIDPFFFFYYSQERISLLMRVNEKEKNI